MKKQIALLLAGVMAAGVMTACGSSSSSTAGTSGSTAGGDASGSGASLVFTWWGNQTRNERTQAALDLYSEQNPGVTFDPQFAEWSDYWNKLATASAGHALPDIVQMDYSYLEQYASNDLLVDLTPYIENGTINVDNVDQGILDSGKVGEGIYALCNGVNVPALLYNKTLLDDAGITIKDNMTMDEFIDVCKEVYEKTGYKTNIAYGSDAYIDYFCRAYDEIIYESDALGASVETLDAFYSLYEDGIAEGWLIDPSVFSEVTVGSVEQDPMVYGTSPERMSWCFFAYSNQLTATKNAAPEGMEIGMTTWPSADPAKSDYLKPSQFFSITVDSANPDEAAKVLDFITNSVDCNNILLGERGVPISSEVANAIGENLTEDDRTIISFINDVVTPNSSTISPPAPAAASEAYSLNKQLVEKVCYGELTAADAAQQMFDEGGAIMSK